MLRLKELELIQLFRHPGGAEFVDFCDQVIRATCWAHGVPQSEIFATERTDAKDGGVDERVACAVSADDTGYFGTKTVWQFKAADEANISVADLSKEANKPYARQCIESGHGYRICICDHLTPEKRDSLEQSLAAAAAQINGSAPLPRVLGIKDICELANDFAALVMQYRPGLASMCILFEQWTQMMTRVTPKFVPSDSFEQMKSAIMAHTDFAKLPADVVLALHGQSGVGKTRGVFESLRARPDARTMVIYLSDEDQVGQLANTLLNSQRAHAVIVADECSLATRVKLSRTLSSCRSRIRCICIDNSTERPGSAAPELIVKKPSYVELRQILADNFPEIAPERIRAYAELSEGFVRLAADMCCHYDDRISQAGHIGPIVEKLEEYYRERLGSEERMKAVEAVALLKRVKRKGESPTELDLICKITGLDPKIVDEYLTAIKDAPGFVEKGALYYRVTPELIAMIAFEAAWKRWAEDGPDSFLRSIPDSIQEAFLERVSDGRNGEVRNIVQGFFRRFADSFTARDLADLNLVNRFIKLVETDPETYLPLLRRILESATDEELVCGDREGWLGSSGPRRQLVWLAEQFVQFEEFFYECERILYVLARNECENSISNNATNIWQQLFRLQLSGTPLSIDARLKLLAIRLDSATEHSVPLLAGAVESILEFHGSRLLGPSVVAGRMVPPEWRPTPQEYRGCVLEALKFILAVSQHQVQPLAQAAKDTLLQKIEWLTRQGWIDELRPIVAESQLAEDDRARLVSKLKAYLAWVTDAKIGDEYARKVQVWIAELAPHSLHSRLIETVGARPWDHFKRENEWESSLKSLASELMANETGFENELIWLTSPDIPSAFNFGYAMGSISQGEKLLDRILSHSAERDAAFARGYIAGLLSRSDIDAKSINLRLDQIQLQKPLFSFQLALAGGERVNVFERAVRLIADGRLPAYHMKNFTHWVGRIPVTDAEVLTALRVLLPYVSAGDASCSDVLMDFLGARLHAGHIADLMMADPTLFWTAITEFTEHPGQHESFWWGKVLQFAAPSNPRLAIKLACKGLVSRKFGLSDEASSLLTSWAVDYPAEIMSEIGSIMLDEKVGLIFFLSKFPIFSALDSEVVIAWLTRVGAKGAQCIARHLPPPFLDGDAKPIVPDLTAWVLSTFEQDDRVFAEFCAGVHSFQSYTSDAASVHESEAAVARKFFSHPLRRIREWAKIEHETALENARRHREWEDAGR